MRIMEVCGTHTETIARAGLRNAFSGVEFISGPGCPVCVTSAGDIDAAVELTEKAIVTSFGDMFRVRGSKRSLSEAKAEGADARMVYSIEDSLKIARQNPKKQVVHFAIGFETTTPHSAYALMNSPENFSALCSHKTIPNALEALFKSGLEIGGLLLPGHVSAIIGTRPYEPIIEKYNVPAVVAGFKPEDVKKAVGMIKKQVFEMRRPALQKTKLKARVENGYPQVVRAEGNPKALALIDEAFEPCDSTWRGIGKIAGTGLKIRKEHEKQDAIKKFSIDICESASFPKGCACGEVLMGRKNPSECRLFGKACTPEKAVGPCMVSREGACGIAYRFGRNGA